MQDFFSRLTVHHSVRKNDMYLQKKKKMFCLFIFAEIQDESLIVDFPEHKKWTGLVSEMELVASADLGSLPMHNFFLQFTHCK